MADEEEVKEEKKPKKGGSLVLIIVAVLFVILLAVVGMIGYFMFSGSNDAPVEATPAGASGGAAPASKGRAGANAQRGSDYANMGAMYPLESFTVNLLTESVARYIKCTMQLEQSNELLQPELDKKTAVIRDIVISTLASKTFEEVSTSKGKERLKDELVSKINEILTDGFIKNIYFTDFVAQ